MSGGARDGIATIISPMPLGGLVGRCAAAVAVSAAHYRPISSHQQRLTHKPLTPRGFFLLNVNKLLKSKIFC